LYSVFSTHYYTSTHEDSTTTRLDIVVLYCPPNIIGLNSVLRMYVLYFSYLYLYAIDSQAIMSLMVIQYYWLIAWINGYNLPTTTNNIANADSGVNNISSVRFQLFRGLSRSMALIWTGCVKLCKLCISRPKHFSQHSIVIASFSVLMFDILLRVYGVSGTS